MKREGEGEQEQYGQKNVNKRKRNAFDGFHFIRNELKTRENFDFFVYFDSSLE